MGAIAIQQIDPFDIVDEYHVTSECVQENKEVISKWVARLQSYEKSMAMSILRRSIIRFFGGHSEREKMLMWHYYNS